MLYTAKPGALEPKRVPLKQMVVGKIWLDWSLAGLQIKRFRYEEGIILFHTVKLLLDIYHLFLSI